MFEKWLGSTRFFFAPPDKPNGGNGDVDTNATNDTNDDDAGNGDDDNGGDPDDTGTADDSDPDGGDDAGGEPDATPGATAAERKDWRDRQLDRQHRKIKELERERDTLRAIAEGRSATPVKKPEAGGTDAALTPEQARAAARAEIQAEDAQTQYDRDCNKAFADGAKRYKDNWETMLGRLPKLGGIDPATMVGILATDDPAKVIYSMASNPDEYERIMDLSPAKRLAEMVKLALPDKTPPRIPSNAPDPVVPLNGRGRSSSKINLYDDNVADEDWYAQRERQRQARFAAKQSRR